MASNEDEVAPSPQLDSEVKDAVATLSNDDPPEAVLQILETDEGKQVFQQMVSMAIAVHEERHSGPLPAPKTLAQYDHVVPGAAERIIQMAEREQAHRHQHDRDVLGLRKAAVEHVKERETRGQRLAGWLSLAVLLVGTYLIWLGQYHVGAGLIASTMVAIAAVFVVRQYKQRSESKPKTESTEED